MIRSKSGKERYITEISNGEAEIYADVTQEKGGSGKYFRPHDLLEAGYAACLSITTRMILESMHITYEEVSVQVELKHEDEANATFDYDIDIVGDLDEQTKRIVLRRVRNCPVKKTLSKQLSFKNVDEA